MVTPFKITEGSLKGQEILVNRGWVAQSKLRPETRPQGQVEGEVNISGIVRKTEGRAQFAPKVIFFLCFFFSFAYSFVFNTSHGTLNQDTL